MSVYSDILSAVKTKVEGSGVFASTPIPVSIRKRAFFSASHGDTPPAVMIAPGEERIHSLYMPDGVWVDYPVHVLLVSAEGGALGNATELQYQLDRRQELRALLWKSSLSGVSAVFDCDYDPHPAFDLGGLDKLYDVSVQLFTFRAKETR